MDASAGSSSDLEPFPVGQRPLGPRSERTRILRHPERAAPDRVEDILAAGRVAHVSYVDGNEPRVIPFLYGYEDGRLILHGDPASHTLQQIGLGILVAACVTIDDGLVVSSTAAGHSMNYRSVVVYGVGRRVLDLSEKRHYIDALTERCFPGRRPGHDYQAASEDELARLEVVEVIVEEASAKIRVGS